MAGTEWPRQDQGRILCAPPQREVAFFVVRRRTKREIPRAASKDRGRMGAGIYRQALDIFVPFFADAS